MDASKLWGYYQSKPRWAKVALFIFIIVGIIGLYLWSRLRRKRTQPEKISAPVEALDNIFSENIKKTEGEIKEVEKEIEDIREQREKLMEDLNAWRQENERVKDEIGQADSIDDITSILHSGK